MQDKSKLPILIFPEGKLLCGEAVQEGESSVVLEPGPSPLLRGPVFTEQRGGPLDWSWD